MSETNGTKPFKISDLVNKLEPFRLEYDGFVLEGRWWKYKTTTPAYAKKFLDSLPVVPESGSIKEKEEAQKKRTEALEQQGARMLADTIESWNAVDENDQPLPITLETFNQLPGTFLEYFGAFLGDLREGAETKKKSQASPSTL